MGHSFFVNQVRRNRHEKEWPISFFKEKIIFVIDMIK